MHTQIVGSVDGKTFTEDSAICHDFTQFSSMLEEPLAKLRPLKRSL